MVNFDANGNTLIKFVKTDGSNNTYNIPLTAFNDLRSTMLTPVTGWTFNYNINNDLITSLTVDGGTITQGNSMAILSTSTASSGLAQISTRNVLRYTPGLGALVRITAIFTTGVVDSMQIIGVGDDIDGFFFGYNGEDFSILRVVNGVFNWTSQENWNYDVMNGTGSSGMTLNPTLGNVYTIQYQWLGYGVINFFIEETMTGQPILVHRIQYPNTSVFPTVLNPTFPILAKVENSGNILDIVLQTPSAMAFVEGEGFSQAIVTENSINASVSLSNPTDQNIITLRNVTAFASKTNRTRIRLNFISCSTESNQTVRFHVIRNATFGSTLTYSPINVNTSVIEYSTSSSSATGGVLLLAFELAANRSTQLPVNDLSIFLNPGETLTLQASCSSNTQLDCSIGWRELW